MSHTRASYHFYCSLSTIAYMVNFLKNYFIALLLGIIFIAATWALFRPEFFQVHDYLHGTRIAEMLRGFQEGQLPVIWSGNLGYGYGMPLFEFYAPLPFYVGALLYWLGIELVLSIKLLYLICTLGAMWGAYKLGLLFYGRLGAVMVAGVYTLAPYRALNLYLRGALSEAWGMLALPWILYFSVLIMRGKKSAWIGLVISLATLFLSHNLTTLMFVPFSLLFAAVLPVLENKKIVLDKDLLVRYLVLGGSYLLAGGLSAFYMIPALMEKQYTQVEQIFSGYFWFGQHFLYLRQFIIPYWGYGGSIWGPNDEMSFFLGYGLWIGLGLLALTTLIWSISFFRTKKKVLTVWKKMPLPLKVSLFSFILMTGALLFTTAKATWFWETVPGLSYIQFPWRFLAVASIFGALAIGGVSILKGKIRYIALLSILVGVLMNARYFRPERYLADVSGFYTADPELIRTQMSSTLPDYIPSGVKLPIEPATELVIQPEKLEYEVLVDRAHEKLLSLTVPTDQTVTLAIAHYPGWELELDGERVDKQVSEQGLLQLKVPAGQHRVGAALTRTPVRAFADSLTLLSALIAIGFLVWPTMQKRND